VTTLDPKLTQKSCIEEQNKNSIYQDKMAM